MLVKVVHFLMKLIMIVSFLLGFLDTFDEVFENEQVCVCLQLFLFFSYEILVVYKGCLCKDYFFMHYIM